MPEYKITLTSKVKKGLRKLEKTQQIRVARALDKLATESRPRGTKKLTDYPGWRLRVGDTRILYTIDDKKKVVRIYKLAHRSKAY